jgi:hypothetical protein
MCELNRQQMRQHQLLHVQRNNDVYTMYKTVDKKVRPVDIPRQEAPMEFGREDWKARAIERQRLRMNVRDHDPSPHDDLFKQRYAAFLRGTRLTTERVSKLHIGDQLTLQERAMLIEMLFNREGALSWQFEEARRIHPDVCPPYKIRTIPHKAWQIRGFAVPKAMEQKVVAIVDARLNRGTWERCDS